MSENSLQTVRHQIGSATSTEKKHLHHYFGAFAPNAPKGKEVASFAKRTLFEPPTIHPLKISEKMALFTFSVKNIGLEIMISPFVVISENLISNFLLQGFLHTPQHEFTEIMLHYLLRCEIKRGRTP